MKLLRRFLGHTLPLFVCAGLFVGCETAYDPGSGSADVPPGALSGDAPHGKSFIPGRDTDRFRVGDTVTVKFSGTTPALPDHEEQIKEDGTINLNLINSVKAAGRTAGELQKEIQDRYTNYYVRLTVTVNPKSREFSVGGEVKQPGYKAWFPGTTVVRAIQSAGDFTDYAKKTKVRVTRMDGSSFVINVKKAITNPSLDRPIMPGDTIHVDRRVLFD